MKDETSWKHYSCIANIVNWMKTCLSIRYENEYILKFIKQKFESILRLMMKYSIISQLCSFL